MIIIFFISLVNNFYSQLINYMCTIVLNVLILLIIIKKNKTSHIND